MTSIDRSRWVSTMQAFTERNASRRTLIELNDAEANLQDREIELQLPLRGVAYDPRDDSIEIMVGSLEGTDNHLTHIVRSPTGIDLVTRPDGRDDALWIEQGNGGTRLTLL